MIAVFITHLSSASAINYKLLDMEANVYANRFWSGAKISKEAIGADLRYMDDSEETLSTYSNKTKFNELYKNIKSMYKGNKVVWYTQERDRFISFAKDCKRIFNANEENQLQQAAVHLLLERVEGVFHGDLFKAEKSKALKANTPQRNISAAELKRFVEFFSDADKNIAAGKFFSRE